MRVIAMLMVVGFVRLAHADSAGEPEPVEPDPAPAAAYPERVIDRPLVLPQHMLALRGALRVNLSADSVASPVWFAPSAFYGLLPKLQVGVVHDPGLCFLGTRDFLGTEIDECEGGVYDDFALDGLYSLLDRPDKHVAVAGHVMIGASSLDPVLAYLRAGALARYTLGTRLALIADLALRIGLSNRDAGNKEALDLPIQLAIQATDKLALFAEAGLLAPLAELTDAYYTSLGVAGLYALRPNLDVGVRFAFPRLTGGRATGSNASADTRQIDLVVTYRR